MTIELLHADCMEYMAGLPDKAFDLAIVDPPYGIEAGSGIGRSLIKNDSIIKKQWDASPPPS